MILSGLKKLAAKHNMTVANGVAYGSYYGYTATLHEGNGWKAIVISCTFADSRQIARLQSTLDSRMLRKQYRVTDLVLAPNGIRIVFHDNPGTMKKLEAFSEWFFPQLEEYGVSSADICPVCGQPHDESSQWYFSDYAQHLHVACAQQLLNEEDRRNQAEEAENATRSYVSGLFGAVLGGLLGAALWGAVLYMGYYASLVGIAIGLFASKGYDLLGGKQKKGKIFILLLVTILSVIAGTMGAYGFELVRMISTGELSGYVVADAPWMLLTMCGDPDFLREVLIQIGMGMLYALLGVSVILLRVHKETKNVKMKQMN